MRSVRVIGIGAGDPSFLTVAAIDALQTVDVFFVLDKGPASADLTRAREALCTQFIKDHPYRLVTVVDPARDRTATNYAGAVDDWRDQRANALAAALAAELPEDGVGGILVWGDPALYDGTIQVLETILASGTALTYDVIPGISSVQALAAAHRVALNRTAGDIHITTGRRLAAGLPAGLNDVVVMLDADLSCKVLLGEPIDIYWGAYLGTPHQALIAGRLDAVFDEITTTRAELREQHGWIMDTYLLRRVTP